MYYVVCMRRPGHHIKMDLVATMIVVSTVCGKKTPSFDGLFISSPIADRHDVLTGWYVLCVA